jgi:hypothetical protein
VLIDKRGKPGDMIIEIRTTDDTMLAHKTIAEANAPSRGWAKAELTKPVSLSPGNKYRIYVYSNEDSPSPEDRYFWQGNTASPYSPTCNTEVSVGWSNYHYAFKTYSTLISGNRHAKQPRVGTQIGHTQTTYVKGRLNRFFRKLRD